jgi:hypothetical protein
MTPHRNAGRSASGMINLCLRLVLNRSISTHGVLRPVNSMAASAPSFRIVPSSQHVLAEVAGAENAALRAQRLEESLPVISLAAQ